jgi:hypothetical protein
MRIKFTLFYLLVTGLICFSQNEYKPEDFHAALLQTKTGAMIVYTGDKHSFTLDIVSKNIKPSEEPNFVIVDNTVLQSIIIPFPQKFDFENMNIETQKQNLLGYMNYELDYIKNELKEKIDNEKYEWVELNNKLFLLWFYDMPKNKNIEKQVYLTTVCFDHILNLNTPLERERNDFNFAKDFLIKISQTIKLYDKSINLDELYKELN